MLALGLDSSNYRSSAAWFKSSSCYHGERELLFVPKGGLGLRQSDAVFAQTKQLPQVLQRVLKTAGQITCVGVSQKPRPVAESYMPCFLVGVGLARAVSGALGVPLFYFSHQEGHLAAAALSAGQPQLFGQEFLAFHVSGGTTEVLKVTPQNGGFSVQILGGGCDLHAGQLVDRVGVMLGLPFPAGEELERLALKGTPVKKVKISVKGCSCNLSGMQNVCQGLQQQGTPAQDIAATLFYFLGQTLLQMAQNAYRQYPLPILFSGGVMANSIIKNTLTGQLPAYFATPELSGDNAVGIACLALKKFNAG